MNVIAQISIYVLSVITALLALWKVDFNRFIRIGQKQFAILVYVLFSLALGFLVGKLFIELGTLILDSIYHS